MSEELIKKKTVGKIVKFILNLATFTYTYTVLVQVRTSFSFI